MEKKTQKPKIFLILRIIAVILMVVGSVLLIKGINYDVPAMGESGWFDARGAQTGFIAGGTMCIFFSVPLIVGSFTPEIRKMSVRTAKYLQEETKDDVKDMVDTNMDITRDARQENIDMMADGFSRAMGNDQPKSTTSRKTKYCSNCGGKISATSKFCEHCGTKVEE